MTDSAPQMPSTGDPRVDAVVARLGDVDGLAPADQLTELARMQTDLAAVLDADSANGPAAPA